MKFTKDSIKIDAEKVVDELCQVIRTQLRKDLKKSGAIVGISGGIDSSVCAALCAKALGPDRIVGIMMPEKDSSPDSESLARELAETFGFKTVKEDLSAGLAGLGCYEKRDEAIKSVFPEFDSSYTNKIVIPSNILEKDVINFFQLVIQKDGQEPKTRRMPLEAKGSV